MWKFARSTSHGGKSVRRIFYFVLATIVATFSMTFVLTPNSYAADASWKTTNSINYGNNSYTGPADKSTNNNLKLPEDSKTYTYVEPESTSVPTDSLRKIHVIYFEPNANLSSTTTAKYQTYTYQSASIFTNPSSPVTISIDAQAAGLSSPGVKSCDVEGIGWVICPITNFLAKGMDFVFGIVSSFLTVRPVQTDHNNALFRAWSYMRSFANIAFVIAFLIIIYSQLTNLGLSNYGIKKMMPRLIIAAILVNLSYYVCAVLIDVSNILGYGLQDVFINIRNGLVGTEGNSWNITSWQSITGFILSGGTAATGVLFVVSTYTVAGSLFLLLPSLITAFMAVLVALLILAGRQALITILVILAPLAFVAYLLPNTEKWFEKWRSTMMTMLILFPAFSLIFGGSQLASAVIIQNADSINVIILALLVQVAPLFITPTLIKLSGSVLGKLADIANNLNRKPIDAARKWSESHANMHAARQLATPPKKWHLLRRNAQFRDRNRRLVEGTTKNYQTNADSRFHESMSKNSEYFDKKAHKMHIETYKADTEKQRVEHVLAKELKSEIQSNKELLKKHLEVSILSDEAKLADEKLNKVIDDFRAGVNSTNYVSLGALANRSKNATIELMANATAIQIAKRVQQKNQAVTLLENTREIDGKLIRDYIGAVDPKNGAESALAHAVNTYGEADKQIVAERDSLIKYFNLSGGERQLLATKKQDVVATDKNGYQYTFRKDDDHAVKAAIKQQLVTGSVDEMMEIMSETGCEKDGQGNIISKGTLFDFRTTAASSVVDNKLSEMIGWMNGVFSDNMGKGEVYGKKGMSYSIAKFLADGAFKPEKLAKNDADAIKYMTNIISLNPEELRRLGLSDKKIVDFISNKKDLGDIAISVNTKGSELYNESKQNTRKAFMGLLEAIDPSAHKKLLDSMKQTGDEPDNQ